MAFRPGKGLPGALRLHGRAHSNHVHRHRSPHNPQRDKPGRYIGRHRLLVPLARVLEGLAHRLRHWRGGAFPGVGDLLQGARPGGARDGRRQAHGHARSVAGVAVAALHTPFFLGAGS
ncbi:MAG: hypothetical protein D6806_06205, partial [Deltaproteobacteria bacterium]